MIKNNKKLHRHDQTIINGVCSSKIGLLPPQFGVFNFQKYKKLYRHVQTIINVYVLLKLIFYLHNSEYLIFQNLKDY